MTELHTTRLKVVARLERPARKMSQELLPSFALPVKAETSALINTR